VLYGVALTSVDQKLVFLKCYYKWAEILTYVVNLRLLELAVILIIV